MNLTKILKSKNLKQLKRRLDNMSKTLEERQKEWDEKYDSPNSEPFKSIPTRPSIEDYKRVEDMQKPTQSLLDKLKSLSMEANIRTYEDEKQAEMTLKNFKGELVHLILQNLNPLELEFCKIQKEVDKWLKVDTNLQRMYILIGKILEKVIR